ncbi:MAG: chromate transporter [Planctomycetes bacterium]|nr:chromate transporter [Planctomycetota bacterium]
MSAPPGPPRLTLAALARRFLRFGATAFGGPVPQIAALHAELVEHERWTDEARFRRVLAVYQALPGPEATELCIWFGMLARGRLGGLVAGLAFVLPGLSLMLLASWLLFGLAPWPAWLVAAFAGMQAVVVALVARGAWRLWRTATRGSTVRTGIGLASAVAATLWAGFGIAAAPAAAAADVVAPGAGTLLGTGLGAGLLTFGGAYTVLPFLQQAAVGSGGWMGQADFVNGLAVGSVLPAPMVIVGTWVGWAGGGVAGALLVTVGIFAPAFVFPLCLHAPLERAVQAPRLHALLDAITAAVGGLVVAIALQLAAALVAPLQWLLAAGALLLLALRPQRMAPLACLLAAALVGAALL